MKKWTKKEVEILKINKDKPFSILEKILPKRTLQSIIGKKDRMKLGRKSSFYWSDKEDEYLAKNYHKRSINELARSLSRSFSAIHARRIRLIKKGIKFEDKKNFLSKYWREQYRNNKDIKERHLEAIKELWGNSDFRERHRAAVLNLFKDQKFFEKHKTLFLERRNSKEFRRKQSQIASKMMISRHQDPDEHKRILRNIRQNPSLQQIYVYNYLSKKLKEKILLSDWNVLDCLMEIDIAIPRAKIAIEWDGSYWHNSISTKERDRRKNEMIIKSGWKFIRVFDDGLPKIKVEEKCEQILELIKQINSPKYKYTGGVYI